MSNHYIFNESGSIPGVPGTFAGVRVDVGDDGALDVQPLPQHPHFEAAEEEERPAEVSPSLEQPAPEAVSEHQPEEEAPKEEQVETTEPEQPASPPEESPVLQETTQEQV